MDTTKECAFIATFVALVVALQLILSGVAGVELVTPLFAVFSFVMGVRSGVISAIAFCLLRTFIFGFFPSVFLLYIVYYPLFALGMALLGKWLKGCTVVKKTLFSVLAICVFTALFTLLDDVITPLVLRYTLEMAKGYFFASLPVMGLQMLSATISTAFLFIPLYKVFAYVKNKINSRDKDKSAKRV